MKRFADLHFHPGGSIFNRLRNTAIENDNNNYHPWNISDSDIHKLQTGKRAFGYSQCDFAKCIKGDVKLAFASLYPMEKGFFHGYGERTEREEIMASFREAKEISKFQKLMKLLERFKIKKTSALDYLQSLKMGFSVDRINFIQGQGDQKYDYYEELIREYNFYLTKDNILHQGEYTLDQNKKESVSGKYVLAKDALDIERCTQENTTTVVLTIEGAHAFGIGNTGFDGVADITFLELQKRISDLKNVSGPWKHPVFFLTLAHHFNNTLCGHAHSLPSEGQALSNQTLNMNEKIFEPGFTIVRQLLGITKDQAPDYSRRVLIDVKHMSARARRDYYELVVKPYNEVNPNDKIPIIASHVGHSGFVTLQDQIENLKKEHDNAKKDNFYAWNINISDEDVCVIHESEGLIGLSFDQRILGIGKKILGVISVNQKKGNSIEAFEKTIKRIVKTAFDSRISKPENIWNCITLGSDFEGYVDPIDQYSTVLGYEAFAKDLAVVLKNWKKSEPQYFVNLDPDKLVDKICFLNAQQFVIKHFNRISGQNKTALS